MIIIDNSTLGAQVFGLLFTLIIFYYFTQTIKLFKKMGTHLLTKTNEKDPSPSKGAGKRKKTTESGDKKSPKKGKLEPHVEKNSDSIGVGNHDNDGYRTPEEGNRVLLEGNTDLGNDSPPSPPGISEEARQEIGRGLRNIHDMLNKPKK